VGHFATPDEVLIVLSVCDGVLDTGIAHLPAESKTWLAGDNGSEQTYAWADLIHPPLDWPSACGDAEGWIYRRAGVLENLTVCAECVYQSDPRRATWRKSKRRQRDSRPQQKAQHGTRSKYVSGCKCEPCLKAEREYQREKMRARRARVA
jgi:hypothetical protein